LSDNVYIKILLFYLFLDPIFSNRITMMATLFLSSLLNAAEQTGLIQTRERQTDKKDEIHKKLGIDLLQIDFKFGFKQLQLK